ncbi:MAG: pantoate--beta-alanine ligase, partial [Planctomycetes bacterium]|nr:pantoate--beta-alanine ligase [Planctomycetota bacterium]
DLNLPTRIVGCPLVRDADGLAISSRNAYLSGADRRQALALGRAVAEARERIKSGERDARRVADLVEGRLDAAEGVQPEYVAVVDPDTLAPLDRIGGQVLVAVAAYVGKTRLIDNVILRGLSQSEPRP